MKHQGVLLVISAPSGAGKRTLIEALRRGQPTIETTISATTRPPRPGESEGLDYYFLDRNEFERRRDAGLFVEWAEVHGNLYGTLHAEMERCLGTGADFILELDVQGMRSLKRLCPEITSVFLAPPSQEELERRLRRRGTDGERDIQVRLSNARVELEANTEYDYLVINDEVERAAADLAAILRAERCRPFRHRGFNSVKK